MARPRSAGFDGQRGQILSSAAAVFAREGYASASMAAVAEGCGVSKATLYHYVRDKQELLAQISLAHVARLEALVRAVDALRLPPEAHLRCLIERFTAAYADAQSEHRVLTEAPKFLAAPQRRAVREGQQRVVQAFADAVLAMHPELAPAGEGIGAQGLAKALAMLLFGMINWTFTWFKPQGPLSHAQLAPIVSELFIGGLRQLCASTAALPAAHAQAARAALRPRRVKDAATSLET